MRKFLIVALATVGMLLASDNAQAMIVFSENFESPSDVDSAASQNNTNGTLPDNSQWVGATQGFGAGRRGIVDESSGHFTEVGAGEQAFAFRYTNSGLTTAAGTIGSLTLGTTYTVTFDVVRDLGRNDGLPYDADLFAWDPDVEGVPVRRDDVRNNNFGTILAGANGTAEEDDLYKTVTFSYTVDELTDPNLLGRDVTLRFKGATTSATIDNVVIEAVGDGPTPLAGDFNGDGTVDAADYTLYADNLGQADESAFAAGTGDGMNGVDAVDYTLWRDNFGQTTPPLLGGGGGAVPEPATVALLVGGLGIGLVVLRRK